MIRSSLSRQIVLLVLAIVTAFVFTFWASILSIRTAMDRQARVESVDLMQGRIQALQEQVALIASDYHNWTDVYRAAADQDFESLYSNYGITAVRGDVFQYAQMFDGPFDTPAAWKVGAPRDTLEGGILSAKTMANLRQRIPELNFIERETFDFFEFRSGSIVMFSASSLLPEDVFVMPEMLGANLAIAVIGKVLTEAQLAAVRKDLRVDELRAHPVAETIPEMSDGLTLPLDGADGRPALYLSWQPPSPGTVLFERIRPVMVGVTIAFLVMSLAAVRLLRDRARTLADKEAEAATLARVDLLTGLPNRMALREHLERFGSAGFARFAAVSIDIDRFKQINDIIGHGGGDTYLRNFAERLHGLADKDTFVSRQGGDEFILIVRGGNDLEARVSDKCREIELALRDQVSVGGYSFSLEAAKGLAISEGPDQPVDEVLLNADRAMYAAKRRQTQEIVRYDMRMEARDALDSSIEKALRSALDDRSEFFIEYQPIVNARFPGGIVKFEALARWNSPTLGRVAPADFIRVAEATGLILPLARLLLEKVCADLRANAGTSVSINVSPVQLTSLGFASELSAQIEAAGLELGARRDRGYGDHRDGGQQVGGLHPPRVAIARVLDRARRFRNRVLVGCLSREHAIQRAQDRPLLHHREGREPRAQDDQVDARPGAFPEHDGRRRRHRNRAGGRDTSEFRLRHVPGVLLRPSRAARRVPRRKTNGARPRYSLGRRCRDPR